MLMWSRIQKAEVFCVLYLSVMQSNTSGCSLTSDRVLAAKAAT